MTARAGMTARADMTAGADMTVQADMTVGADMDAGRVHQLLHRTEGPMTDLLRRTGAPFGLGQLPLHRTPTSTTRMICGYCSTGCALDIHLADGEAVGLTPAVDHPVNLGMACPKGWEALAPMAAGDRLTQPLVRNARGVLAPTDWETAITTMVDRFRRLQVDHGDDALAFLSTGQIPSEEMALLGALTKFGMGIRHGDGNTRQCMATAVVAYKQAFGFDAPPYTYADFEASDVVVLIGSNLAVAHPIMWERLARNRNDPQIIVIDPRVTETAMGATQHLALAPKSDLVLLYGLARLLLARGAVDREFVAHHTTGFDGFAAHVNAYDLDRVCTATGLPAEELERVADTIAAGKAVSLWWTMGVNQSHEGVRTAQAIINLALMTGNIGRPGTGANSITGQCNAMGSRLFSNTTSLFGGHAFDSPAGRAQVATALGIDAAVIPKQAGWAYDQIVEAMATRTVLGLWVIATNGAHSWIGHGDLQRFLGDLDTLVVQDLYGDTETAQLADIVLPAAGWGEKEGTFINSERRLGLQMRVRRAPGKALTDFNIFRLVAQAWGCGDMFAAWESPEAAFAMLRDCTVGQPCDISGIRDYRHLDSANGIQWPHPAGAPDPAPERRLFGDGRFPTPDGRARFIVDDPRPPAESTRRRYPLVLLTGRGSTSEWHTRTRTSRSPALEAMRDRDLYVDVSPADADTLAIHTEDEVVVSSPRGQVTARAFVTASMQPGQVFMPMHDPRVNTLTMPSFDPHSRQPSYKHAAVMIRLREPWEC